MIVVPDYLKGLDPDQQKLAMAITGPVRGIAGAGAGKTTTLTHRIAYMIKGCGILPQEIMVNTFTKKAANEMRERLQKLIKRYDLGFDISDITMGTMHSIACKVAKFYGSAIELPDNFTILDQDDAESILDKITKSICGKEIKIKPAALMGAISFSKNSGIDLKEVLGEKMSTYSSMHSLFCQVADSYERRKVDMNTLDFDDLLLNWLKIINKSPKALAHMQDRWKYVMVDEYQDTNWLQDCILNKICGIHKNIFIIGDDKQSIYSFRSANINNILDFHKVWTDCETIHLPTNYRSTPQIVGAATAFILSNHNQLHQPAKTPNKDGQKPAILYPYSDREQNDRIVEYIQGFIKRGVSPEQIAVLYRNNRQPIMLEKELIAARIPFYKKGARFWQSAHLRLAISWMKMLHNPLDKPAMARIIDMYPGLGDKAIEVATSLIKTNDDFESLINNEINLGKAKSWPTFQSDISKFVRDYESQEDSNRVESSVHFLKNLIYGYAKDSWPDNYEDRMEDFNVLAELGAQFGSAGDLLDEISLQDERSGEGKKKVLLSTVHGCVHPNTLVETPNGLMRISEISDNGLIAAPEGEKEYKDKFTRPYGEGFILKTKSDYALTVSPDHGMTTWRNGEHVRIEAKDLIVGDWLRVRLGSTYSVTKCPILPSPPSELHRNTKIYRLPTEMSEDFAEFLGLMVADGSIYKGGFRVVKRYQSVVDRFSELAYKLFGINSKTCLDSRGTPCAEVNSVYLSSWLLTIGGLSSNNKYVPDLILKSSLKVQAKFLRGLFEDGTVNEKEGHVDHVHLDNKNHEVTGVVQTMLLRFGIISARKWRRVNSSPSRGCNSKFTMVSTLYIYSQSAKIFRDRIGFIAPEKNKRLNGTFSNELMYSIPLSMDDLNLIGGFLSKSGKGNCGSRGYLSRHILREALTAMGDNAPKDLIERLSWQYERIKSIEEIESETMCVDVPDGSRFLQNGFDGWNSKGLEFRVVIVMGMNQGVFPGRFAETKEDIEEERRLFYVAMTRAKDILLILSPQHIYSYSGKELVPAEPSMFLSEIPEEFLQ